MQQARPSVYGPFAFDDDVQTDYDDTNKTLDQLKSLMVSVRQDVVHSTDGSDAATNSGFDPEDRTKIQGLIKKVDVIKGMTNCFEDDVKAAIATYDRLASNVTDLWSTADQETRQKAAHRVLRLLMYSPAKLKILLSRLGIEIPDELDNAMYKALGQMTDSQTDLLVGGPSQNEELIALRKDAETLRSNLKKSETTAEALQKSLAAKESELGTLQKTCSAKARDAHEASRLSNRARRELEKANDKIAKCEVDLETQQRDFYRDRERFQSEITQLHQQLSDKEQARVKLEAERNAMLSENTRLTADLASAQTSSRRQVTAWQDEKRILRGDVEEWKQKARDLEVQKEEVEQNLKDARVDVRGKQSRLKETEIQLEARGALEQSRDQLQEELKIKVLELQKKDEVIQSKTQELRERSETGDKMIKLQAQQATLLLNHLSLGVESQNWGAMMKKVLADSQLARPRTHWRPWDIASSCSTDASLQICHHDQSVNIIALDVLAMLDAKSSSTEQLLSYLQALQEGLSSSLQIVKSIFQLLPSCFVNAASDPRLHIMHLVAMFQIIKSLTPLQGHGLFIVQAIDKVNARVGHLVRALEAYDQDPTSEFQLAESIVYPELALFS
uniref:WGS project CBME000000000 data, contig CS3487_c001135 n=1 Tax=Fusarium pseudograminearum CS3487 TaxID=1318458 RepID=A0A096PCU7_FUSPS|nr:unnamed protein product [Fusarium pseudograminearum CS3487]